MFVVSLVLLFIIKLKFPRGTPISDVILRRYGRPVLNEFRKTERLHFKLEKNKCDSEFLKLCKAYNCTPKSIRFKLYKRCLHHSKIYKSWQCKLLNYEIKSKTRLISSLEDQYNNSLNVLRLSVSLIFIA